MSQMSRSRNCPNWKNRRNYKAQLRLTRTRVARTKPTSAMLGSNRGFAGSCGSRRGRLRTGGADGVENPLAALGVTGVVEHGQGLAGVDGIVQRHPALASRIR